MYRCGTGDSDAGRTFAGLLTPPDRRAAYSDLVQLGPGTVGILHEAGVTGAHDTIGFRRVRVLRGRIS
ncbi:hypothetical protein LK08_20725 [Streptomyces sp. MUSC 125]|uniref:sialidase family protein n=1 Tax=unclassified Streptomyces TaxID=2593676 RepID=UPI00057EDB03|nr:MULTISPECIES: sialidase family protein [unclassified Streptomyces]KIE25203.1 hypothetical protein LK08_20725 [Streptomyces sp. MUSC 125]MCH0559122.1 exo-alpha-sialidase [Streptomyces sp. MUM 16J]